MLGLSPTLLSYTSPAMASPLQVNYTNTPALDPVIYESHSAPKPPIPHDLCVSMGHGLGLHRVDQEECNQPPSWITYSLYHRTLGKTLGYSPTYLSFTSQAADKPHVGRLPK